VNAIRRGLGLTETSRGIALVAQMLPYKGHRTLMAAAPHVLSQFPGTKFFFVGALENPAYEAELRTELQAAGLADRFTFTGWRDDLPAVVGAMDVIVVATTTPEPAALSLIDAMAAGRPVVASRTGGTPEIVIEGQTALLFPPADARDAGAAILSFLRNPELADRFGRAGRARVEELFTRDRYLSEIATLCRSAARNGATVR
jgi:glycosyltransferase involved in cell wall biosynthesis